MKAEQRSSIRKAISHNIVINYDLSYSKRWKVRNLSLNGAMVEMRRDELLPETTVGASRIQAAWRYGLHRLPAEVVRTDRNRVALRFRNCDDRAYTVLVNLVYSA